MDKETDIKQSVSGLDEFSKDIEALSKSDFDGHTEFRNLSYRERLMWLSQAVQFSVKYSKTKETTEENPL